MDKYFHLIIQAFTWLIVIIGAYWMFSIAIDAGITERDSQRKACIASGGQYAESPRLNPSRDFCIGKGNFVLDYNKQ